MFNHLLLLIAILVFLGLFGASSQVLNSKYNRIYDSYSLYWVFDYVTFVGAFFICYLILGVFMSKIYDSTSVGGIITALIFV